MADKTLIVVTPLVIAHTPDGDVYVSQGAPLPGNIDKAQRQMLVDEGQVAPKDTAEAQAALVGPFVAPIPDQPDPPEGAQTEDESLSGPADDSTDGDKVTSRSSKAELVAFAVKSGMPQDEADNMTVAQLRDKYVG